MKYGKSIKQIFLIFTVLLVCMAVLIVSIAIYALKNPAYDAINKEVVTGNSLGQGYHKRPFWNVHALIDKTVFGLGSLLNADIAYFRDETKTLSFEEHLEAVRIKMPARIKKGMFELKADTLAGKMQPAYRVYHWYADSAPTIIYNHGASQYPFDAIFTSIFKKEIIEQPLPVNLIIVRTPFHRNGRLELNEGAATLSRFMAIMAVSVKLSEQLVRQLRLQGSQKVELAGISLGGFITNRHHLVYNSADYYIPVVAGTDFSKVFLITSKADPTALKQPALIQKHLDLSDIWQKSDNHNVFPILGRFDTVSCLEHQGPSYGKSKVEVWDTGHITAALSVRALRFAFLRRLIVAKDNNIQ